MIFRLRGDIDLNQSTRLRVQVSKARAASDRVAIFDCSEVTFCDSEGFSVFLYAVSLGMSVRVSNVPTTMRRAMETCGLDVLGELFVVE